jgi:Cu/Ag efflux pump CusA
VSSIEDTVAGYQDVASEVMTYSDARVRDVLQRGNDDVVVRVYGEDPAVLNAKAREVRAAMAGVDGITRVDIQPTPQESTVEVQVDLQRAQEMGVKPGDVRRAASILLGSITVGNLFEEQKVFDVVVWGAPGIRKTAGDIENLLIDTPSGGAIRLGDVAAVKVTPNDAVVRHESVARYVELTADVTGRNVADVNREVDTVVKGVAFPLNHHAEVIGGYADRAADATRLLAVGIGALLVILLLLQAAFRSWRLAALALVALAASLAGTLVATLFTGGTITLGVVAGMIAVLGIAARGVVVLVSHLLHLERREEVAFGPELVVRGTRDRVAPTLTSGLAMVAVLAPAAVLGMTGLEVLQPAAIAVIGGLVTTIVVTLFVVPAIYLKFGSVPDSDSWVEDLYEPVTEDASVRI